MRLPFVTRRRYERALAAEQAETLRVKKVKDEWWQRHDAVAEELAAAHIVNGCLTDDLTTARAHLAEHKGRRTVPEVLEEHDVHRKALADALGPDKHHLGWDQLIAETAITAKATAQWRADCARWEADYEAEKNRADRLQAAAATTPVVASRKDIKAWEGRAKAHDEWTPSDDSRPLVEGGWPRPTHPATELLRAQERCRALQAIIDGRGKQVAS